MDPGLVGCLVGLGVVFAGASPAVHWHWGLWSQPVWRRVDGGGRVSAGMGPGGPVPPLACGSSLGGAGASRPESWVRTFAAVGSDTKSSTIFTSENVFFTL